MTAVAGGIRLSLSTCSSRKQKGRRKIREASEIPFSFPFQQAWKDVMPVRGKKAADADRPVSGAQYLLSVRLGRKMLGPRPPRITSDYPPPEDGLERVPAMPESKVSGPQTVRQPFPGGAGIFLHIFTARGKERGS